MKKADFPLVLRSIAAFTAGSTAVLILLYRHLGSGWMLTAAISFGTTAYHFVMRLAVGYLLPKATDYRFDHRSKWFQPRRREGELYRRLGVKHWKGRLPTYAPEQFSLKTNTVYRVIQNMCGAELVHEIIVVLSFLPLAAVPIFGEFPVFLVTSCLAGLYDSLFVIAQRYNRPRLVRIYEKQLRTHGERISQDG